MLVNAYNLKTTKIILAIRGKAFMAQNNKKAFQLKTLVAYWLSSGVDALSFGVITLL